MINKNDNPYKELIEKHEKILVEEKDLFNKAWKWWDFFWNNNPIYLEIWTWMWNFFSKEASKNLDKNFVWIELKYKRLYNSAEKSITLWVEDFIMLKTFGQNIDKIFNDNEIDKIYVFFPDPWGKKDRQKKHRLFQEKFIKDLYNKTKDWWKLVFKTDHREYFDTTLDLFKEIWLWQINIKSYNYEKELDHFEKEDMTEFEHIFRRQKVKVNYVEFIK